MMSAGVQRILHEIQVDLCYLEYAIDKTDQVIDIDHPIIRDFIHRQQTWAIMLDREIETERIVEFARETLDDLAMLPTETAPNRSDGEG